MATVVGMVYIKLLNNTVISPVLLPYQSARNATSEANAELLLWFHCSERPAHH